MTDIAPRVLVVGHIADRSGAPMALLRLMQVGVNTGAIRPAFLFAEGGDLLPDFAALGPCINLRYGRFRTLLHPHHRTRPERSAGHASRLRFLRPVVRAFA